MTAEKSIAAVVVDVVARGTDRPFDYHVPETLRDVIEVGSRVRVSFGHRKVMGYVVRLSGEASYGRLKPILDVMDLVPPLTPELVDLGLWMAETCFCHPITALNAMVPAVLKGRYRRVVRIHPRFAPGTVLAPEEEALIERLRREGERPLETVLAWPGVSRSLIRQLVRERRLLVEERVGDRVTRRRTRWVKPAVSGQALRRALDALPPRALRQREILSHFLDRPEAVPLSRLLASLKAGRSSVDSLVEKGLLQLEEREELRDPFAGRSFEQTSPPPLTPEQERAFRAIVGPLREGRHHRILLHGVTGSGKTEVYLQAIDETLKRGRQAIVLVPEISLTPQMVARFKGRFGPRVAVLHSGLSGGERFDEWRKIRSGEVQVAIGARSAIFAPFSNLGLIVIDEEHESSYKQEEQPKYHAREVAFRRGMAHRAVVVLGTATPAVETIHRAGRGELERVVLSRRVQGRPLPRVDVVDMREELREGNRSIFSRMLQEALEQCVSRGEQAVLFLNRRGFSTFVLCRACGKVLECSHCDISLTFHRTNRTLRCHYCGHAEPVPEACPACDSTHIRYFGTGTQRVEEEIARLFPGMRVIRMDVDTTNRKGAHEELLGRFGAGEADVLLGTQMIAKGLDFPRVTLVGVIAADTMLHLPDFRAAERTFQLLTQVSGRAGRHNLSGRVVIQTYSPMHYSIDLAARADTESFYRKELLSRKQHRYPPFCRLFTLLFSHPDRQAVMQASFEASRLLKQTLAGRAEVLGPVPATIPRMKDRYRLQVFIKYTDEEVAKAVKKVLRHLEERAEDPELRISVDRDG
ncbi:replication restart DNA helicase PriA [Planifilum fimeticola]|uniref:Replication restart protein PriA n=1 Tax=Planifilum fimeticola TaxID=201975 RepID=A0A2T0LFI4_9BACL|nr:primosomal protein N' [Planifilum fimeticola]PRX40838.1 replication restart DNA helicase PriA [Planifilum fimeticola]